MDITVVNASNIPDKAYLSIRAGDVRRQTQFKPGETFQFDLKTAPRTFMVDVFEKIGSRQVTLSDLTQMNDKGDLKDSIEVQGINGRQPIQLDMKVNVKDPAASLGEKPKRTSRHQAALKAKTYLDGHEVQKILQGMVHSLLSKQPEDPLSFMTTYLKEQGGHKDLVPATPAPLAPEPPVKPSGKHQPPGEDSFQKASAPVERQVEEREEPKPFGPAHLDSQVLNNSADARNEEELAGFPVDGSEPIPDLSEHNSVVACMLREDPSLYNSLQDVRTPLGVPLAQCIKTGIDNRGHRMIKTSGLIAGDEDCYDVFSKVFLPVISKWHENVSRDVKHFHDVDLRKVIDTPADPTGKILSSVQVRGSRNLRGLRMPPAMDRGERNEVERVVTSVLLGFEGHLQGDYHPLIGSQSYVPKPGGMSDSMADTLSSEKLLFEEPDSLVMISSGFARCWPEARGVFTNETRNLAVWLNEVDHIQIRCCQSGNDVKGAFAQYVEAEAKLKDGLQANGYDFCVNEHLGYLTSSPTNIGTSLHISVTLEIPMLSASADFKALCKKLSLNARLVNSMHLSDTALGKFWEMSTAKLLGVTEVDQVNTVISGCQVLVSLEQQLAAGENVNILEAACPQVQVQIPEESADTFDGKVDVPPGLGDDEYPGFPTDRCPEVMPDLAAKHSVVAGILRSNPAIYDRLKDVSTPNGVSFAKCVKTSFDNNGHPMIKTIGGVAGDQNSYTTFAELFNPLIEMRHCNADLTKDHPTTLDETSVSSAPLDPSGTHAIAVRIRTSRNVKSLRFPTACSFDERREAERMIVDALAELTGELQGEYHPLRGSESYLIKPGGMDEDEEEQLREEHVLFEEPDSEVLLSSGFGRHWPDARGVFVNDGRTMIVWVNEEDHMRMVSLQRGSDLKQAFERLCRTHSAVQGTLQASGQGFARHDKLGFLGTCPSNIGTCLVASVTARIPYISAQPKFRQLCKRLKLHAHVCLRVGHSMEEGVWELYNLDRLGTSEVDQVNAVIDGCRCLFDIETRLEQGDLVDLEAFISGGAPPAEQLVSTTTTTTHDDVPVQTKDGTKTPPVGSDFVPFAEIPGLGDEEAPGFPTDECPEELTDLKNHHSIMAEVLRNNPDIYTKLRTLRTHSGISLAKCMKPGVDSRGHPMIKTVGAVAGDAMCYQAFRSFFDPIISIRHGGFAAADAATIHPTDLDPFNLDFTRIDPTGKYVLSSRIKASRNLKGLRFPPAISRDERNEVERIVTRAFTELSGSFEGEYLPLASSTSYFLQPAGMDEKQEAELERNGLLFQEPDSPLVLACGTGRHWPEGRGIFANLAHSFAVWVNEEDHVRFITTQAGDGLREAFAQFCHAESLVRQALQQEGQDYAHSDRLGFLTSDPSNLGMGGLKATLFMNLPLLGIHSDFKKICRSIGGIQVRSVDAPAFGRVWSVVSTGSLGVSEVQLLNRIANACAKLIGCEQQLERGEQVCF